MCYKELFRLLKRRCTWAALEIHPVASRHAAAQRWVIFSHVSSVPVWIWDDKQVHLMSPESSLTDEPTLLLSDWVIKVELKSHARMLHRMEVISFINLCCPQMCVCLHHFLFSDSLLDKLSGSTVTSISKLLGETLLTVFTCILILIWNLGWNFEKCVNAERRKSS